MELKRMHMQLALLLMIALAMEEAAAADLALPGCIKTCGNVTIPYPFGVGISSIPGKNCFLEEAFEVICNTSNSQLYWGNIAILNINVQKAQMDMLFFVSSVCYDNETGNQTAEGNEPSLKTAAFSISSKDNKFISVGCDTFGYLNSFYNNTKYSTGCLTRCDLDPGQQFDDYNGNCSGIGCCEVEIPPGMRNITLQAYTFKNFNETLDFNNCSYSFVAKKDNYTFSTSHLQHLPFEQAPLVVDWTIGNQKCRDSRSKPGYACQKNSYCEDTDTGYGYRCRCVSGYDGNPYLPNGCIDINECERPNRCKINEECNNFAGGFNCTCVKGYEKDDEGRCRLKVKGKNTLLLAITLSGGFMALFVGTSWTYLIYQKRKLIKLKEKFFKQNGGVLLKQELSAREDSSQTAQIFTAEQLKKATNNYDESLIIGRGGYGTVFKGFLADNRIVAIKKSKVVDQSQIEQFINEVVVLSQINHRNVVKLLGCCLETEVPLLVYEFANNGTLFNYLHNENKATNLSWEIRLRIAVEASGALSYLHSAASVPIIHRDVKSANILLDDTYAAKVSDFGASRLVPLDQTELATMVQGTVGYLDPEYMQTSQLTEKSDVYSFGVVLVELLTGEKALSFERPEEKRSLAMHFLSSLKENRLFEVLEIGILNEENKEEIKEVAILAMKCLRLKGEERPSMKEVAMELEGVRRMEKHPWTNPDLNLEETEYLLHKASSISEQGDSSNHQNKVYDSIKDHILIAFDDGR